jgi:hypothetical protein
MYGYYYFFKGAFKGSCYVYGLTYCIEIFLFCICLLLMLDHETTAKTPLISHRQKAVSKLNRLWSGTEVRSSYVPQLYRLHWFLPLYHKRERERELELIFTHNWVI